MLWFWDLQSEEWSAWGSESKSLRLRLRSEMRSSKRPSATRSRLSKRFEATKLNWLWMKLRFKRWRFVAFALYKIEWSICLIWLGFWSDFHFQSRISLTQEEVSAVGSELEALKVILLVNWDIGEWFWWLGFFFFILKLIFMVFLIRHCKEQRSCCTVWIPCLYCYLVICDLWILFSFQFWRNYSLWRLIICHNYACRDEFISQMFELNFKIRLVSSLNRMLYDCSNYACLNREQEAVSYF